MAGLLVSVRSAEEARAAVEGGATIIDVKEPDAGPLGRASVATWQAVRDVVPPSVPMSVALGELCEWSPRPGEAGVKGISYRKIGLSGSQPTWRSAWSELRRLDPTGPNWVAVAYADWNQAGSPDPAEVLDAAIEAEGCSGILVDTWYKSRPSPLNPTRAWADWVRLAQRSGLSVALAGRLDLTSMARLAPLRPDLFAVRGAACSGSDRRGQIERDRVAQLVGLARSFV